MGGHLGGHLTNMGGHMPPCAPLSYATDYYHYDSTLKIVYHWKMLSSLVYISIIAGFLTLKFK